MVCLHERGAHDPKCPIGRAVAALYSDDVAAIDRALNWLDPARENQEW